MVMTTPVPTSHSQVWRVPAQANLSWRRWPGEVEYVFYHGASGDTHRLSELAGVIMELILEGKGRQPDLLQWLSDQGDTTAETTLARVLEELQKLDFIEPDHASG
ncbi:MAG: HPr-rel-A system PqqD family peptide chaperone [Gammaproteobacteria bacterium]